MGKERQFVVNERGEKVAVVISIEEYEKILEELEDLEAIREYEEARLPEKHPFLLMKRLRELNETASDLRASHPAAR